MTKPINKVLIIQTAFLGDVILGTGVAEKLHDIYPNCELHYLVRKGNENVLKNHPYLKVWVFDKSNKLRNLLRIILRLRKEKFDLTINLQRFFTSGLITIFSGKGEKRGFNKNPLSFFFKTTARHQIDQASKMHEIDRNHQLVRDLTDNKPGMPTLYPSEADFQKVKPYQQSKYVCIAPASVWYTKQWPKEKWVGLVNGISTNYNIYLLGAPGDVALCEEIKLNCSNNSVVAVLAGKLSPLESCALMKAAAMNYVNDSAPLHFASATNAPVSAVFCSTVPGFGFTPLSEKSIIFETEDQLPCRPCGLHGHRKCPEGHFKCADSIQVERLLNSLPT